MAAINRMTAGCFRSIRAVASRPLLAALLIGLLAVIVSALPTFIAGAWPQPVIHDEFSYLLAADTFMHGRLTNPPHAFARFFQTYHELMSPTYASKYPPAQGLALAAGIALFGQAIAGVWISAALACVAVHWMLRAILPPTWALLGALLAIAGFTSNIGWTNSYYGGSVFMLAGALVWGGALRIGRRDRPRIRDAITLAIGLALAANSRPAEGAILSLPALAMLAMRFACPAKNRRQWISRVAIPLFILGVITCGFMALYNRAITGRFTQLPYQLYTQTHDVLPVFYFQPLQHPPFDEERLRWFYEDHLYRGGTYWLDPIWPINWLKLAPLKIAAWSALFGALGYVPLIGVALSFIALRRNSSARWLLLGLLGVAALSLLCVYSDARYFSGGVGPMLALTLMGLRMFQQSGRWKRAGRAGALVLVIAMLGVAGYSIRERCLDAADVALKQTPNHQGLPIAAWIEARPLMTAWLARNSAPGGAVVFVRYDPPPGMDEEWVYNAADIDAQPTVWAHDRGDAEDALLQAYYTKRTAWRLVVNAQELSKYTLLPMK